MCQDIPKQSAVYKKKNSGRGCLLFDLRMWNQERADNKLAGKKKSLSSQDVAAQKHVLLHVWPGNWKIMFPLLFLFAFNYIQNQKMC